MFILTPGTIYAVAAVIGSYALGSLNFAIIISGIFMKRDIRKYGSGNAGATNMARTMGLLPGIITLVLDMAKGAAAAYSGGLASSVLGSSIGADWLNAVTGGLFCGLLCEIGHMFPLFFEFKGGKGVATVAGILAVSDWRVFLCVLAIFIAFFTPHRIISMGSITAAFSIPFIGFLFCDRTSCAYVAIVTVLGALIGGLVIIKHKDNIKRLIKREEKPITFKK